VSGEPSRFFLCQRQRLRQAADLGPVLDLACGRGRHALAAAADGARVVAMDRDPGRLAELAAAASRRRLPVLCVRTDLETPAGIPVRPGSCGAVLVFRFLFRPLAAAIEQALAPGGLLLYETFTIHQRDLPHGPANRAFLLEPGELPGLFPGLEILASWEGLTPGPRPEAVARLAARRPSGPGEAPRPPDPESGGPSRAPGDEPGHGPAGVLGE
jgi:SAM-dependent methyltransferase